MQILKDEIKERIESSALVVFSDKGYKGATMSDISSGAGISVGNVYRYYGGKDDLFYSLITGEFVGEFKELIGSKMETADGIDLKDARFFGPMNIRDENIQKFLYKNRLRIIILLDKSEGTRYEKFKDEVVGFMVERAYRYIKTMEGVKKIDFGEIKGELLPVIYRNLFSAILEILKMFDDISDIFDAYEKLLDYHFLGISNFIG